ncbi:MAG: 2OG-Fe dioxygenase family protein [Bacteroidota bacterium]
MPTIKLPIDETLLSKQLGRSIKSPILVAHLNELDINAKSFLSFFKPFFSRLSWDPYDARRLQVEYLLERFPADQAVLRSRFKDYFVGQRDKRSYRKWIGQLSEEDRAAFDAIRPWRRRAVAYFEVTEYKKSVSIQRKPIPPFVQDVDPSDFRSWPRLFEEAPDKYMNDQRFGQLLAKVFRLVQQVREGVSRLRMTAHFMSVQATTQRAGDNSPEGAHEDGADYIVSALVINRKNLEGGESQVIEKRPDGKKEVILRHILQEGEFIFQADSRDEIVYGTDLWHHVTPFYVADVNKGEAWRDIIGFDINVA